MLRKTYYAELVPDNLELDLVDTFKKDVLLRITKLEYLKVARNFIKLKHHIYTSLNLVKG